MVAVIFDRRALDQKHKRAKQTFSHYNFLDEWTRKRITERLEDIKRPFEKILFIDSFNQVEIDGKFSQLEEEFLAAETGSLDAIISILNLHAFNDLPGALIQIKQALKPDGLFIGALFGGETLYELRDCLMQAELEIKGGVSPRIFPFATKQDMGALLQRAGFALPVVDSEILTVTYSDIFKLMHDLRGMGEGNSIAARDKKFPGRELFLRAGEIYNQKYAEPDGRIPASFEIIFLIGWAPHESQQKPLKPGSAQTRLADALNTTEIKA